MIPGTLPPVVPPGPPVFPPIVLPPVVVPIAICGNKIVEYPEECDTGRLPGCRFCIKEPGYQCDITATRCDPIPYCGDRIRQSG